MVEPVKEELARAQDRARATEESIDDIEEEEGERAAIFSVVQVSGLVSFQRAYQRIGEI